MGVRARADTFSQAMGDEATATTRSQAIGGFASASNFSVAVGERAIAKGNGSIAIGADLDGDGVGANAPGDETVAIGADSIATNSTAVGTRATATGTESTAIGENTQATGNFSTSVGENSVATGRNASAFGNNARATGRSSTALGQGTQAQGNGSVAIGQDSDGNAAVASLNNQFVFGTGNHTYTAPGITSNQSRARQAGPLEVVTTDANGNLASDNGATFEQIAENKQGIAIAMAMANPDLVGMESFGLAANWGHFDGANALAFSAMGVLSRDFFGDGTGTRFSLSGGVGVSLDDESLFGNSADRTVAGRVGAQLTW